MDSDGASSREDPVTERGPRREREGRGREGRERDGRDHRARPRDQHDPGRSGSAAGADRSGRHGGPGGGRPRRGPPGRRDAVRPERGEVRPPAPDAREAGHERGSREHVWPTARAARPGGARGSGGPPWPGGRGMRDRTGWRGGPPPWEAERRAGHPPVAPPRGVIGEDEELVAGRRPVEEAFAAGRPAHRLLVVPQRRAALDSLVLHATRLRIPVVEMEGGTLTALAGFDGHQGVALVVAARRYAALEDVIARALARGEPPFVLVLDSLEDPQNLGTLLRSADAAGVHGVLFPTRRAAPLTPAAVKASAGASEHLLLVAADDLAGALAELHRRGLRVVGAEAGAPLTHRDADLRGALAVVVGSEGRGLSAPVRHRVDLFVRIPMRGRVASLNAAVAGSILLFEAVAQRADPRAQAAPPATPDPAAEGRGPVSPAGSEPAGTGGKSHGPSPAGGSSVLPGEAMALPARRSARRRTVPPTPRA